MQRATDGYEQELERLTRMHGFRVEARERLAYEAGFEHGRRIEHMARAPEPNLKLSTRVFWLLLGAALGAALALGFVEIFGAERILP